MSGKNRRQIFVKGLGNLQVRQRSPVDEADFSNLGNIQETVLTDLYAMEKITAETGHKVDNLAHGHEFSVESKLLQTSKEMFDYPLNSKLMYHAWRYFGQATPTIFQYFAGELARLIPGMKVEMKNALRTLPIRIESLDELELGYDVPQYYMLEVAGAMTLTGLQLWLDPREGLNSSTAKILDVSGFARHATVSSAFATIWQADTSPARFLRFDGAVDSVNLGDVLDVDSTKDFGFELWLRVKGNDGTQQEIFGKKADDINTAGFRLIRTTGNKVEFKLSDGTNSATILGTTNFLKDTWMKIGCYVDRNGNAQLMRNGAVDGAAQSVAGVTGTAANALDFVLGLFNAAYGQIDIGAFRWFIYGAGSIPSNFAVIDAAHYAAERDFYGV